MKYIKLEDVYTLLDIAESTATSGVFPKFIADNYASPIIRSIRVVLETEIASGNVDLVELGGEIE